MDRHADRCGTRRRSFHLRMLHLREATQVTYAARGAARTSAADWCKTRRPDPSRRGDARTDDGGGIRLRGGWARDRSLEGLDPGPKLDLGRPGTARLTQHIEIGLRNRIGIQQRISLSAGATRRSERMPPSMTPEPGHPHASTFAIQPASSARTRVDQDCAESFSITFFFFGRVLPWVPRQILPRFVRRSPLPILVPPDIRSGCETISMYWPCYLSEVRIPQTPS